MPEDSTKKKWRYRKRWDRPIKSSKVVVLMAQHVSQANRIV
jgi:hypothetical protein